MALLSTIKLNRMKLINGIFHLYNCSINHHLDNDVLLAAVSGFGFKFSGVHDELREQGLAKIDLVQYDIKRE